MVVKDPQKSDDYLVRRLAAIEGYEMISKEEKDEPFILDKDECWVLADNENLKAKVMKLSYPIFIQPNCLVCLIDYPTSFYIVCILEKQISWEKFLCSQAISKVLIDISTNPILVFILSN